LQTPEHYFVRHIRSCNVGELVVVLDGRDGGGITTRTASVALWSRRPTDDMWSTAASAVVGWSTDGRTDVEVGRNAMLSRRISASRQPPRQPLIAATTTTATTRRLM